MIFLSALADGAGHDGPAWTDTLTLPPNAREPARWVYGLSGRASPSRLTATLSTLPAKLAACGIDAAYKGTAVLDWEGGQIDDDNDAAGFFQRALMEKARELAPNALWGWFGEPCRKEGGSWAGPQDAVVFVSRHLWTRGVASLALPALYPAEAETVEAFQTKCHNRIMQCVTLGFSGYRLVPVVPVWFASTHTPISADHFNTALEVAVLWGVERCMLWGDVRDPALFADDVRNVQGVLDTLVGPAGTTGGVT